MSEFYELLLQISEQFKELGPIEKMVLKAAAKGKTKKKIKFQSLERRQFKARWAGYGFDVTIVDGIYDCSCSDIRAECSNGCPEYSLVTLDWSRRHQGNAGEIKSEYVLYK